MCISPSTPVVAFYFCNKARRRGWSLLGFLTKITTLVCDLWSVMYLLANDFFAQHIFLECKTHTSLPLFFPPPLTMPTHPDLEVHHLQWQEMGAEQCLTLTVARQLVWRMHPCEQLFKFTGGISKVTYSINNFPAWVSWVVLGQHNLKHIGNGLHSRGEGDESWKVKLPHMAA